MRPLRRCALLKTSSAWTLCAWNLLTTNINYFLRCIKNVGHSCLSLWSSLQNCTPFDFARALSNIILCFNLFSHPIIQSTQQQKITQYFSVIILICLRLSMGIMHQPKSAYWCILFESFFLNSCYFRSDFSNFNYSLKRKPSLCLLCYTQVIKRYQNQPTHCQYWLHLFLSSVASCSL